MEAAESPAKMKVDATANGGETTKDAEAGKPPASASTAASAAAAAPTETPTEPKDASPPAPPAATEAAVLAAAEEAPAAADVKKDDPLVIHCGTARLYVNGVRFVPPSAGASPAKEEKTEKESPKIVAETTSSFTMSAVAKVAAVATKPKPSPTSAAAKAAKTTTKVAKTSSSSSSSSSTKVSKTAAAKATASTKSLKKGARKKRKTAGLEEVDEKGALPKTKKVKRKKDDVSKEKLKAEKAKKARKQTKKAASSGSSGGHPYADHLHALPGLSAAQMAVQEQMRKALEEDQYSANGSILDTDSDDDEQQYMYKGQSIRLDRAHLLQAAKKCGWFFGDSGGAALILSGKSKDGESFDDDNEEEGILNEDGSTNNNSSSVKKKSSSKSKKKGRNQYTKEKGNNSSSNSGGFRIDDKSKFVDAGKAKSLGFAEPGVGMERDEGSIFGQTTGASNATWVECDKCKKWRRLRGVVDHSKLPKKWYCSMNRNDPERARCSAPEEEYDAPHTPESAADARTRKHLRVWVRRLQCNEDYEKNKLPTLTRSKKRSQALNSNQPHEWIRCCNPSCGKWRAILRIMDAKQNVTDRTADGEWYCVMNTWDEKTASCAAPQENLPAVGCPPWVHQDEN